MHTNDLFRFTEKLKRDPVSGCLEWTGYINARGYGCFGLKSQSRLAHRVAYILANGGIPEGLFVLHRCDNRKCCNSEHLFAGTNDDNMKDMVRKGRQAKQINSGKGNHQYNEGHKLTREKAYEIRATPGLQQYLATRFGVTQPLVSLIKSGKIWRE